MPPQTGNKLSIMGGPELDEVVEGSGGNEEAVGGEGDVVDEFLVALETDEGLGGGEGRPEVHCKVV